MSETDNAAEFEPLKREQDSERIERGVNNLSNFAVFSIGPPDF